MIFDEVHFFNHYDRLDMNQWAGNRIYLYIFLFIATEHVNGVT